MRLDPESVDSLQSRLAEPARVALALLSQRADTVRERVRERERARERERESASERETDRQKKRPNTHTHPHTHTQTHGHVSTRTHKYADAPHTHTHVQLMHALGEPGQSAFQRSAAVWHAYKAHSSVNGVARALVAAVSHCIF